MKKIRSHTAENLIAGYQLCASTEGKSPNAVTTVTNSVKYFPKFMSTRPETVSLTEVIRQEIREFIAYLQRAHRFAGHPLTPESEAGLSGHTINCYVRSLRIFYSWLVSEKIMDEHPFANVKIPPPPLKVIPSFSAAQVEQLLFRH